LFGPILVQEFITLAAIETTEAPRAGHLCANVMQPEPGFAPLKMKSIRDLVPKHVIG
jgi:hypothetical protein